MGKVQFEMYRAATHRGEGAEHTIIHTITAHNPVNLNFTIKVSFFLCLLFVFVNVKHIFSDV